MEKDFLSFSFSLKLYICIRAGNFQPLKLKKNFFLVEIASWCIFLNRCQGQIYEKEELLHY